MTEPEKGRPTATTSITFPDGHVLTFDANDIVSFELRRDVVDTGYTPSGWAKREFGEFSHLTLKFKLANEPKRVEGKVSP